MKKKAVVLTLVILGGISFGIFKYKTHSTVVMPEPIWVTAAQVKTSTLPLEVNAIGSLVARTVEITPETSGHIKEILFKDGTFVAEGAPLIQLDDAIYKTKYTSSRAQLAYSEHDFSRKTLLGKQGAISKQAIDQADADVKERRAFAEENKVLLDKMRLNAPFQGMVGKSKVSPGDYVTTGQSLVSLSDTKHLRIEYNVPEKYFPSLKLNQIVKITSATYPGKVFTGKVAYISPTINLENRSVFLYADVPNEGNELASGMFVNVTHSLGSNEKAVVIPARSLVPMLEGVQVFKVVDGKAYSVPVTVGKRTDEQVQITQGLSEGDLVITDGQLKVKNTTPVKVKT